MNYKIGDKFWIMENGKIKEKVVKSVNVIVTHIDESGYIAEKNTKNIFESKEALIKHLSE